MDGAGLMADGSNIKGAPVALTPEKVEQLLGWMDGPAPCLLPYQRLWLGIDLAKGPDRHVETIYAKQGGKQGFVIIDEFFGKAR